jgi:hypothetical protein
MENTEIWVDAENGDVIGGPIAMVRTANPAISEDAAVRRIINCFENLHWNNTGITNITLPDSISHFAHNRWVLNTTNCDLEIDSTSGTIKYAVNHHNLYDKDAAQNISKDQALQYAEKYLQIMGVSLKDVHLVFIGMEQTAASLPAYWKACFCPTFQGYAFSYDNNITIDISAVNGDLISLWIWENSNQSPYFSRHLPTDALLHLFFIRRREQGMFVTSPNHGRMRLQPCAS